MKIRMVSQGTKIASVRNIIQSFGFAAVLAALLMPFMPAHAADSQWTGPGWYVEEDNAMFGLVIIDGPFSSREECLAAKSKGDARDGKNKVEGEGDSQCVNEATKPQ